MALAGNLDLGDDPLSLRGWGHVHLALKLDQPRARRAHVPLAQQKLLQRFATTKAPIDQYLRYWCVR